MKEEIKIYIASPYTNGWMPENIKRQMKTADELIDLGYYPYVPLLTHFLEIYSHKEEYKWLELDFAFLKQCNALLRLKPVDKNGIEITSKGADQEEQIAKQHNIPVFYTLEDLNDYFKSGYRQIKIEHTF